MSVTLAQLIDAEKAKRTARITARAAHTAVLDEVRAACVADGGRDPNTAEEVKVRAALDARRLVDADINTITARIVELENEQRLDDEIDALQRTSTPTGARMPEQRAGGAQVLEPAEYSPETAREGRSFFRDAYRARFSGDYVAQERLQRHGVRQADELRSAGMQTRALATTGAGSLVIPQYLIELFAPALRSGRPIANMMTGLPLPPEGMSLTIPRLTTATSTAVQVSQNTPVSATDGAVTDLVVPVCTAAGQQDISRQTLERGSGVDEIIYADLAAAYAATLDALVINGTGTAGQPLGIINQAGVYQSTLLGAAATIALLNLKIAGLVASITQFGGISPKLIGMHPRRWGWMQGQVDSTGRPLIPPLANGPYNAFGLNLNPGMSGADNTSGGTTIVGQMQGLPLTTDANIPTTLGTLNEDVVLVMDTSKLLLWEDGDGAPRQLNFEQTTGGSLTTKLVVYGYFAFTAGRYPGATGKAGGVDSGAGFGLIPPVF